MEHATARKTTGGGGGVPSLRRARWLRGLAPALAIFGLACDGTERDELPDSGRERSNLIVISVDTLRRDHLTLYGYERQTSPRIGKLGGESIVFDTAIAAHTNTAPSHASMFTGLYPSEHGLTSNFETLRPDVRTLAEILDGEGYSTAAFASAYTLRADTGLNRGFAVYDAPVLWQPSRKASETWSLAQQWLKGHGDEPFFLFFHLFDPHAPYEPPTDYALRFLEGQEELLRPATRREHGKNWRKNLDEQSIREYVARYDGEIAFADEHVGHLLDFLETQDLLERSVVVFLSDHGETLFERPHPSDHGARVYDEQLRIPLILRFPRQWGAGQRVASQVSHVDLTPTLLPVLGIPTPEGLAGHSLLPLLRDGAGQDPRPAFSNGRAEPQRVPHIREPLAAKQLIRAIRLPGVKLIEYPTTAGGWYRELFDLDRDPAERNNLAEEQSALAARLHAELEGWSGASSADVVPAEPLSKDVLEGLRALGYVE